MQPKRKNTPEAPAPEVMPAKRKSLTRGPRTFERSEKVWGGSRGPHLFERSENMWGGFGDHRRGKKGAGPALCNKWLQERKGEKTKI